MVYNETGLEGFNMSFEMLSDLGIKKYEMCRDDIGRFFARSVVAGLYLGLATILSTTLGTLLFKFNCFKNCCSRFIWNRISNYCNFRIRVIYRKLFYNNDSCLW